MNHSRWVAVAVGISLATRLSAQTPEPQQEVIITGLEEQLPQQLEKFGTHVDTITRDQIRNGSYVDVAQSLQALAPGLYVQPKNGPFDYAYMSLLGSRTGDILWTVDGIRINNRLYNGTPPLDTLPSAIVDRLEVLQGGQALFYGTDAVAGGINIVTHPFTTVPQGTISVAADTNRSGHIDGAFSDTVANNQFVLYGSKDKTDGYRAFRDQDYEPSSTDRRRDYDIYTVGVKYGYRFTDNLRLSAGYQQTEGDLDFALPYRVARDVNSRTEKLAMAKLDYDPSDQFGLYLKGDYHSWRTNYDTFYNDLGSPGTIDVLYDGAFWGYDDRGINALARFSFKPGIDYFVGYDLQRYGGRDEVLRITPSKEETQAFFAQVRLGPEILANTHLSLGARYNSPDVGANATVWTATGQYDISGSLFIKGTLGTNFRLPTAEELFADDPQDERGNPNLRPERSKSINLSIGGTAGDKDARLRWELIGFAREIKDLIDYDQFDEVTEQYVFNNVPGTVKVRGAEISLNGEFVDAVGVDLSFTRNTSGVDGGNQINRVPETLLKASVDYHPGGSPFGATLSLNYTGHVWASVGDNRVQYGNYAIADVSGRYTFGQDQHHKIVVSLQNIFDKEYGVPGRGCRDTPDDGPYDCSIPYQFVNLGLPRTLRAGYQYAF